MSDSGSAGISASIFKQHAAALTALKPDKAPGAQRLIPYGTRGSQRGFFMPYLPVLLGLSTAFCWGTSDYLSRSQSEKVGHYNTVVYMHVTTLLILLVLLPILTPSVSVTPLAALALVAAGALNFFAFIYLYRAFHKGVVSVVAPVAYTYPVVTTVFSVLFLGVVLAPVRIASIGCVVAGVLLLSTRFSELRRYQGGSGLPSLTAGVGSALVSSIFFGMVYVGIGYATPVAGYVLPVVFLRGVGTVVGIVAAPVLRESIRPTRLSFSRVIMAMGVLEAIGFLAFNYGLSLGSDSLPEIAAISGMGGAVAALYALKFLKERLERNQAIGLGLAIAGVFALLYLGG
ncbi:MAG TPA: DMT family transporter [Nitrososphaerales archaeon]|nr:DMT family transporter [Nitrososphaerales archaeon]